MLLNDRRPKEIGQSQTLMQQASLTKPHALRKSAEDLEAAFVTQMLKSARLGDLGGGFGGGVGAEQFNSFLLSAYAQAIVQAGGFGLANTFYAQLSSYGDAQ